MNKHRKHFIERDVCAFGNVVASYLFSISFLLQNIVFNIKVNWIEISYHNHVDCHWYGTISISYIFFSFYYVHRV